MGYKSLLNKKLHRFFRTRLQLLHGIVERLGWCAVRLAFLLLFGCVPVPDRAAPAPATGMVGELEARLQNRAVPGFRAAGKSHASSLWLRPFYRQRSFRLAWSSAAGPLLRSDELIAWLDQVEDDGLRPGDFRLELIRRVRADCSRRPSTDCVVDLDLLLTDAFLRSASALHRGELVPEELHVFWEVKSTKVNLASLLRTSIDLDQVVANLDALRPTLSGYLRLRTVLRRYRALADGGGWGRAPASGDRLQMPDVAERLRRRLRLTRDMPGHDETSGADLAGALGRFQRRHGLTGTGRLDAATVAALQVPLERRIEQLRLNLERWRWLPHRQSSRYLLVRIADYQLDIIEDGAVVDNMRVIVGKPFWRTPIFSSWITQLVLNPRWHVPASIAEAEILPLARSNPGYLERNRILVHRVVGDSLQLVSSREVDWQHEGVGSVRFTQLPGERNPLGRLKFHFDNPYGVFLHDTPSVELFAAERREFSHGCIRVERSLELAAYALAGESKVGELEGWAESDRTRLLKLATPLPIYVMTWTAWVDEEGVLQFRDDQYGADARLRSRLASRLR